MIVILKLKGDPRQLSATQAPPLPTIAPSTSGIHHVPWLVLHYSVSVTGAEFVVFTSSSSSSFLSFSHLSLSPLTSTSRRHYSLPITSHRYDTSRTGDGELHYTLHHLQLRKGPWHLHSHPQLLLPVLPRLAVCQPTTIPSATQRRLAPR